MSRRSELRDGLASVPLFSACTKRDLQIVARHTEVVEVPSGTTVTTEGDPGDAFYFVLGGEAAVRRHNRAVTTLGPGSYFGELAIVDPAPRNATVQAVSSLTIGVLPARAFRAMLRDVPTLNEKLMRGLARRLRGADRCSLDHGE